MCFTCTDISFDLNIQKRGRETMTLKDVAIQAALGGGKILKENFGTISGKDIEDKNPFDYVTIIDKKSEQFIIDFISKHYPDHKIFAEESGKTEQKHENRWIIDPLDGTTNYIHGYPNSAVSIALEKKGGIILGVIYDPFRNELFYAEKTKGAYLNNKPIHVSTRSKEKHCLIATGFPFRNRNFLSLYWDILSEIFMAVSGIRRTGSAALDLAHVACGRFDGFWELKLSPWDIAAGSIIIEEAGGRITDFEGKNRHIWTGDVVASNNLIHEFLLKKIQKVFSCNP